MHPHHHCLHIVAVVDFEHSPRMSIPDLAVVAMCAVLAVELHYALVEAEVAAASDSDDCVVVDTHLADSCKTDVRLIACSELH